MNLPKVALSVLLGINKLQLAPLILRSFLNEKHHLFTFCQSQTVQQYLKANDWKQIHSRDSTTAIFSCKSFLNHNYRYH